MNGWKNIELTLIENSFFEFRFLEPILIFDCLKENVAVSLKGNGNFLLILSFSCLPWPKLFGAEHNCDFYSWSVLVLWLTSSDFVILSPSWAIHVFQHPFSTSEGNSKNDECEKLSFDVTKINQPFFGSYWTSQGGKSLVKMNVILE